MRIQTRRLTTTITTKTGSPTIRERGALLRPDYYYADVRSIDLAALRARGVRALLLDVDNTVSPHHSAEVVPEIREWISGLEAQGLAAMLVSNNWHADITARADDLGLPVIAKAMKPLPGGFRRASDILGVPIAECAVVGDQLFTDVLGGKIAGAVTVLVEPLTSVDLPHTRILRCVERVIMGKRGARPPVTRRGSGSGD